MDVHQLATEVPRGRAVAVARSAYDALAASGRVYLPPLVARTLAELERRDDVTLSRALAAALCAACGALGIPHALEPVDASERWMAVEDALDTWFSAAAAAGLRQALEAL